MLSPSIAFILDSRNDEASTTDVLNDGSGKLGNIKSIPKDL